MGIVPTIFGVSEKLMPTSLKRLQVGEVNSIIVARASITNVVLVSFSKEEQKVVVVMVLIANYQVRSVLIDTGNLANIIFKFVFNKMNLVS